jgi:hypothetical protein
MVVEKASRRLFDEKGMYLSQDLGCPLFHVRKSVHLAQGDAAATAQIITRRGNTR